MKPIIHSNFGFTLDSNFNKQVEIWIDNFNGIDNSDSEVKIFVQIEPNEIMGLNNHIIDLANNNKIDFIFTYEPQVLYSTNKAVLFEYGTKWIHIDKYEFKEKEFSISTVCGHKTITKNHQLRQKIWYKQNRIINPKKFFLSKFGGVENFGNNPILGDEKEPLFDSMFHICIENVSKENFFTEKLIDCLLCKTIPIYVGCPNISNYFNMNGFFIANSAEEAIDICNNLKPDDYYSRKEAVEENSFLAMKWIDYNKRLEEKIKEVI
ncbi:MAG: hypothetical protein KatS3mg035_1156 [Bacteroidia bacterium]|nr:MAG: hypothetical protein KatS3mg035_1156 [Bacteroidia bacterium]